MNATAKGICCLCGGNLKEYILNYPFFRHFDYETIAPSGTLFQCGQCHVISNPRVRVSDLSLFESEKYARSKQTSQNQRAIGTSVARTRCEIQSAFIAEMFKTEKRRLSVLDVGCFDGRLLKELDKKLKGSELWGYDINKHVKSEFPKSKNFFFVENGLESLSKSFDLITFSHSIMYFENLRSLLEKVSVLLSDRGFLFIQIPNLIKSPLSILLGDQFYTFTRDSTSELLNNFGFSEVFYDQNLFAREIIMVFQKSKHKIKFTKKTNHCLSSFIKKVRQFSESISLIREEESTVLGSTLNAAFVDEIIRKKLLYFIDENPKVMNSLFRGKNVIHPKDEIQSIQTILPYGEQNNTILERIKSTPYNRYKLI